MNRLTSVNRLDNAHPEAAIVNVSSVDAHHAHPERLGYAVAKGGVETLTRLTASQLASRGIRVNAVVPGAIATRMTPDASAGQLCVLQRRGTTEEVANAIVFLASAEASYITGTTLRVDGGFVLTLDTNLNACYAEIGYGDMIRALNTVHYAGETSFYGSAGLRPCEEALFARYGQGSRIVDIGCGAGRVTRAITARGGNIVGVDVNLAALDAARALEPRATFVQGSMADLPLSDTSSDQVWCLRFSFNALPTDEERQAAIRELWRVCAPGGNVFVEAFNWYFSGRFGLLRIANELDTLSRRLRWYGQGRTRSLPLPPRMRR